MARKQELTKGPFVYTLANRMAGKADMKFIPKYPDAEAEAGFSRHIPIRKQSSTASFVEAV